MFCFKLRSRFFPLGVALATCTLAWLSPAAWALQMPMPDDPVEQKQADDESDVMRMAWSELNPTGSRAKFKMPAKPRFVERTFTPVKGQPPIKVRLYIGTTANGSVSFTVNYNDMSDPPRGAKAIANTLEGVMRVSVANVAGQLLNKRETEAKRSLGLPVGRQFAFAFTDNKDNQYVALSRAFIKGRRLYQLTVLMEVTDEQPFNEEVAARFLNSFQIVKPKSDMPPVPKAPPEAKTAE